MANDKKSKGIGLIILSIALIILMVFLICFSNRLFWSGWRNISSFFRDPARFWNNGVTFYTSGDREASSGIPGFEGNMETETYTFSQEQISKLSLTLISDDIEICETGSPDVTVTVFSRSGDSRPSVGLTDGILWVEYDAMNIRRCSRKVRIQLPSSVNPTIDAETVSGDIHIRLNRSIDQWTATTVSGDISVNGLQSDTARLYTTSGDMAAAQIQCRSLIVKTVSGEALVEGAIQQLDAKSTSGDISYTTSVTSSLGSTISTVSGDILLTSRSGAGFNVNYSTTSGDMTALGGTYSRTGSKRSGTLSSGSGGIPVTVRTTSGDLLIK